MNKLLISDIKNNLKLFLGTAFAIVVSATIIVACLNLVFSSVDAFDYGQRFSNVDTVILADQTLRTEYIEDGKTKTESMKSIDRVPLSDEQVTYLDDNYDVIFDYTFDVTLKDLKSNQIAGHNISSIALSGFELTGTSPKDNQVVIDENLASINNLDIGDTFTIKTNTGIDVYEISGIVKSSNSDMYTLQNYLYFSDDVAEDLAIGCYSASIIDLSDESDIDELKQKGYKILRGNSVSKAEINSISYNDISLMVIFITTGSVCLMVSLFVIAGAVQFSIINRFKTLALLRVLGFKKSQIKRMLSVQTFFISIVSAFVGVFLSIPVSKLIIVGYRDLGIVGDRFEISSSVFWNIIVVLSISLLAMCITYITAGKPLSKSPASALRSETEFTSKTSILGIIFGIIFIAGGISIIVFTPMYEGIGIGMAFCAMAVFLGGYMCLTPIIVRVFNGILSLFVKRFEKSLGRLANANIKLKASKFAIAAVSISIMLSAGTVMVLNNITFIETVTNKQYEFADEYEYVRQNVQVHEIDHLSDLMGVISTELVYGYGDDIDEYNSLVVYGNLPSVEMISGNSNLGVDDILVSTKVKGVQVGDKINVWLPDGTKKALNVVGEFRAGKNQDDPVAFITSYDTADGHMYNNSLSFVYSHSNFTGASVHNLDYYEGSASYDVQVGASLLLGLISIILSVVALFNTFAVIMSVRKKEFNDLKVIGAKKDQILKMTIIETLVVTATGLLLGLGIIIICVGVYSQVNKGSFDFVVSPSIFFGTLIITTIAGILAGIIPALQTIKRLKQKFRVE